MTAEKNLEGLLEELRQALPDPFESRSKMEVFLSSPAAQELIGGGERSINAILDYLANQPNPALARPAVILLSRVEPATFYPQLLGILAKADEPLVQAFETGLWLIQVPEEQIARDLVRIVSVENNPYPLLLLQRPAANAVRGELAGFIQQRRLPLSLYALYCYEYALGPEGVPLMREVSTWTEIPEMAALAGLYLLKLGSKSGLEGIRVGLLASSEQVRTATYYGLREYLPEQIVNQAKYDPKQEGATQEAAADVLINFLATM
jgi:hypothetical protein